LPYKMHFFLINTEINCEYPLLNYVYKLTIFYKVPLLPYQKKYFFKKEGNFVKKIFGKDIGYNILSFF
jgi:hypothetical protein